MSQINDSMSLRKTTPVLLIGAIALILTVVAVSRSNTDKSGSQRALVWSDEFNGPDGSLPSRAKWQPIEGGGGFGNDELQYYTDRSENVQQRGGDLVLTAERGAYRGTDGVERGYTSAALQTKGLFATRYGRITARIDVPDGNGLWPAFWLEGADVDRTGWPQSGEIDAMETHGSAPDDVTGSLHGPQAGMPRGYALHAPDIAPHALTGGFHVYGVTWRPGRITFTLDGRPYGTLTPRSLPRGGQWVFNRPEFLLLDLAVGGNDAGNPAHTQLPAHMYVDWVRVYR